MKLTRSIPVVLAVSLLAMAGGCNQKKDANAELKAALDCVESRRRAGMAHVSLSTDFSHHVGKPGVAAVEDGKTPDGQAYEWSKAGRAGKPRRR